MISLKESWQTQRQQRQQEILHRQQQVQITLDQFSQKRQMQADHLREELRAFQQQLQTETQAFIAEIAADRAIMSQELFQNLDTFHQNLTAKVAAMQQQMRNRMQMIQAEVTAIRLDTQLLLKTHQQQRLQNQLQLMQNLARYVTAMRAEVQAYLADLEAMRYDRATHLQQKLRQSHEQRKAEMRRLFNQLSVFRSELMTYYAEIREQVWGSAHPVQVAQPPLVQRPKRSIPQNALPKKPEAVQSSSPSAMPAASVKRPAQPQLSNLEQTIFNYLQRVQQMTLAEVESTFGINRFAAVDALRSLIKKGYITQRDHMYLIQP